jgi:hypothetical protein
MEQVGARPGVLIASAFGDAVTGGGLFALDASRVERIDRIGSMGLAFDGRRLARALRCLPLEARLGEIVIYDARGVQRYARLDAAAAVHDIVWDGDDLVVVSPWHNAVQWFSPSGDVVREVRYPGPADAWHVNCVARRDGVWYATMFGDFGSARGWAAGARDRSGRIVNLTSGETVVDGLTTPHSLRWVDDMWLVCNSERNELLAIDAGGRIVQRVACEHWTRGFAHDDDFFYVGGCQRRETQEIVGDAQIIVIDRRTWKPVDRIAVQAHEIYELTFVPPALLAGLRRGFDVNPLRTSEFVQYRVLSELGVDQPRHLWPSGDPLPWSDFRCRLSCAPPSPCTAGDLLELPLRVENRSASFFTSAAPAPVFASYKWLDPATGAYLADGRALRTKLPRTVFPGEAVDMTAFVIVPKHIGAAQLRMTLIQEGVSWFDDQDPANAIAFAVEIAPAVQAETRAPSVLVG